MPQPHQFYIDGAWIDPVQPGVLPVINPSTEEVYAEISIGGAEDVDHAVGAAASALEPWKATPAGDRLDIVRELLEVYRCRACEMATVISTEMGAPIDMALEQQVGAGTFHIENYIAAFEKMQTERLWTELAPDNRVLMDPVGVVGLITPWNWPMNQITLKVVAALLAGCTMILKPSEVAPLSGMLFAEYLDEVGVPAGVFNLVNGDGPGVGTMLSSHPNVDMISFTGSTRAGIDISRRAASSLKRVSLELGGKGANIVFADAGIEAVERGVLECFNNTGQSCDAPSRMLVERTFYDEAVAVAAAVAETVQTGPAHVPGRHIGPLVSQSQFNRVQELISVGCAEGARLAAGGTGRPAGMSRGYFARPTVFADVHNDMTIARKEIFGPVLSVIPFDDEEHAIAIANDTDYGLGNYVQSADSQRRSRIARRLRSGMVVMNGKPLAAGAPFGGVKASGRAREGGMWGIEEFVDLKFVSGWDE
jgi:aldehyde dehydrogenase (NAD+)